MNYYNNIASEDMNTLYEIIRKYGVYRHPDIMKHYLEEMRSATMDMTSSGTLPTAGTALIDGMLSGKYHFIMLAVPGNYGFDMEDFLTDLDLQTVKGYWNRRYGQHEEKNGIYFITFRPYSTVFHEIEIKEKIPKYIKPSKKNRFTVYSCLDKRYPCCDYFPPSYCFNTKNNRKLVYEKKRG